MGKTGRFYSAGRGVAAVGGGEMEEFSREMEELGREVEEFGREMEELGREVEEFGLEMEEFGRKGMLPWRPPTSCLPVPK